MANKFTIWINDNVNLSGLKGIPALVDAIKEKVETVFKGLAVGAVAALGTAFWQLTKCVEDFAGKELGKADISAALTQMGQYTDAYKDKLIAMSEQYQKTTNIGDEMWLKAAGQLTRFGMTSSNVDQVFEALKNLTGLMDGNFDGAVMAMQRAMEGEFGLFGRLGITFQQTGDQVTDLNNLMQLLSEKGGGLLEARAETLSGKWAALKNSLEDFRAAIGEVLTDSLGLKDGLSTLVEWIEKLTVSAQEGSLHNFLEGAAEKVRAIGEEFAAVVSQIHSVSDLKIAAGVIGDWLAEKLYAAGVRLVAFLLEKAPFIGYAIGKAAYETITNVFKDSATGGQIDAAKKQAASETSSVSNYLVRLDELLNSAKVNNRTERLTREGNDLAAQVEIAESSQQSLGDRITAALSVAHGADQSGLADELAGIIDTASAQQLQVMQQIAQDILAGNNLGTEQIVRVQIPQGEFIGDPEKTQALVDELQATDEELVAVSAVSEESTAAAKQSIKATGDAIKVSNDAHAIIQNTMASFAITSNSTARIAQQTNEQLYAVTNSLSTVAARQASLQDQIYSLEAYIRSML